MNTVNPRQKHLALCRRYPFLNISDAERVQTIAQHQALLLLIASTEVADDITGIIEDWKIVDIGKGEQWVTGNLFNDRHKRWLPGEFIHTSKFKVDRPFSEYKEGDIIKTLNSTYLLGVPRSNNHDES